MTDGAAPSVLRASYAPAEPGSRPRMRAIVVLVALTAVDEREFTELAIRFPVRWRIPRDQFLSLDRELRRSEPSHLSGNPLGHHVPFIGDQDAFLNADAPRTIRA
jgi:hypothetical protein